MTDTTLSADEETIRELHRGFAEANKTGLPPVPRGAHGSRDDR